MESYIESSVLLTASLLNIISFFLAFKEAKRLSFYVCLSSFILAFLSVISNQPPFSIIIYFILCFKKVTSVLKGTILYFLFIEVFTLLFTSEIHNYILYVPSKTVIGVLLFFIISILFVLLYKPSINHYQKVIIKIREYTIIALAYKDTGNSVLINGKPLIFLKSTQQLQELFHNEPKAKIHSVSGMVDCPSIEGILKQKNNLKRNVYVAILDFEEEYDCILNLYC